MKKETEKVYFAPIYDSARELYWNWSDRRVKKQYKHHFSGGKKVLNYIRDASPRISIKGHKNANHFDLVSHLGNNYPDYGETIRELIMFSKEKAVFNLYKKRFSRFFIRERNELVILTIKERFARLRKLFPSFNHQAKDYV